MTVADGQEIEDLPSEMKRVDADEWTTHSDFVLRNIEMVIDTLIGEQIADPGRVPVACPHSTPVSLSRRRKTNKQGEKYPCPFDRVKAVHTAQNSGCACEDPLFSSDSILDSFAAVAIAEDNVPIEQRYFDHHWRDLIRELRDRAGSWMTIQSIPEPGIHDLLEKCSDGRGIDSDRVTRLLDFLSAVQEYDRTSGLSLSDLPNISYELLATEFASFPGISTADAWWLLLTVFEKPVWPASQNMDRALLCLGLIEPSNLEDGVSRRKSIEGNIPDRWLPVLHRALAGHQIVCSHDLFETTCDLRKFTLPYRQHCQESRSGDKPVVVDLFSGAGGLSIGFNRAGFSVRYAVDIDQHATDTYRLNHPEIPHRNVVQGDMADLVEAEKFKNLDHDVDVVIGGPPCQAISIAGYRSRRANDEGYSVLEDSRTKLYQEYITAIQSLDPDLILMENVQGLINEVGDSDICISDLVLDSLDEIGYDAEYRLVDCSRFGIPQERHRVFIVGVNRHSETISSDISSLFDRIFQKTSEEDYTLRQGLAGLPRIGRGEGGRVTVGKTPGPRGEYVKKNDIDSDSRLVFNHQAREHPKEKDRKLFDTALKPGETSWDVIQNPEYEHLVEYDLGTEDNPRFTDKYRMLDWESQAPTVVAHLQKDANNFIIPDYHRYYPHTETEPDDSRNRGITPREAARLQSFPDDFVFLGSFTSWFVQIGNAVPPVVADHIGKIFYQDLTGDLSPSDPQVDQSCVSAKSDD